MQSLAPSKRDLIAVLPGTAHTITMEVIPVILHYNTYLSLSDGNIKKGTLVRKSTVFNDSFDVSLVRFGSGKSSSNSGQKVWSFAARWVYLPV